MAAMDDTNTWIKFFEDAGIPFKIACKYALTFSENRIKKDMLLDLNKEYLKEMGITPMGDVISILKHARQVFEEDARTNVLKKNTPIPIPVVVVPEPQPQLIKKTSVSVPASRILDFYGPKEPPKIAKPVAPRVAEMPVKKKVVPQVRSAAVAKRVITKTVLKNIAPPKPAPKKTTYVEDYEDDFNMSDEEMPLEPPKKKIRRVLPEHEGKYKIIMPAGTTPRTQKILSDISTSTAAPGSKKTVFERLGDSRVSSTTGVVVPSSEKPRINIPGLGINMANFSVFSRLGSKTISSSSTTVAEEELDEEPKLQYGGILKKSPAVLRAKEAAVPVKKKIIKIVKKKLPTLKSDLAQQSPVVKQRLGLISPSANSVQMHRPVSKIMPSLRAGMMTQDVRSGVKIRLGSAQVTKVTTTNKIMRPTVKTSQAMSFTSHKANSNSGSVFTRLGR